VFAQCFAAAGTRKREPGRRKAGSRSGRLFGARGFVALGQPMGYERRNASFGRARAVRQVSQNQPK